MLHMVTMGTKLIAIWKCQQKKNQLILKMCLKKFMLACSKNVVLVHKFRAPFYTGKEST